MQKYKVHCSGIGDIIAAATKGRTISVGAETAIKHHIISELYERRKEPVKSKYLDKGNEKEEDAIRFLSAVHGDFYSKNEKLLENEHLIGTPDIIAGDTVIDIKCSWSCFTFPYFDTEPLKKYWCQLQGYMALTGAKKAILSYCLMDATIDQVERAVSDYCKANECEYTEEIEELVAKDMQYEHLPTHLRLKEFRFDRDDDFIKALYERIDAMREYATTLIP